MPGTLSGSSSRRAYHPAPSATCPAWARRSARRCVNHPGVDLIAFTGSREVGLLINRQAADTRPGQDHVKRVIAEMGGKNAIIVDDDADLDEAVVGVVQSAFGYSGQKCSACSRVIVLEGIHDAFLARLVEAARAVKIGPADQPETLVGPVIDAEARKRILDYRRLAVQEGRVVLEAVAGELADVGTYVGPLIVADRRPVLGVAQEEIFGPVLAVLKARDLDEALQIANGTQYALTGGLYSRSPVNIDRVKREFRVGNLYINRGITRGICRSPPLRRLQALRHRYQGRRLGLPPRVPAYPKHHREHHAPGFCSRGAQRGRNAVRRWNMKAQGNDDIP